MKATARRIDPEENILSVLTLKERFEAVMRVAPEAFRNTTLTMEDIEVAVCNWDDTEASSASLRRLTARTTVAG
jgi:hypothetical protein